MDGAKKSTTYGKQSGMTLIANKLRASIRMDKSPLFPVHKRGIKPADFLRNYLCPHYDQCLCEAAIHNFYLDCNACGYKGEHVDFLMVDCESFDGSPSAK